MAVEEHQAPSPDASTMAEVEKRFKTALAVPRVWQSLLEIQSFDDLTAFLADFPPATVVEPGGFTRADWPRPVRNDHRAVSFSEDDHTVMLELLSGTGHYFVQPSVLLPDGDRYALPTAESQVHPEEVLAIPGTATFVWRQELV